jgi:hypothetical protein
MPEVRLEEPIELSFGAFSKTLFLDVLIGAGAIFEFKSVDRLAGRHRAQLLQYLMLIDCAHGKLINVRPEEVEHEFVNCGWRLADRQAFRITNSSWNRTIAKVEDFRDFVTKMLRDFGTGLELSLYEEAMVTNFCADDDSGTEVDVSVDGHNIGHQRFRMLSPGVAFKLTAFEQNLDRFEEHARRMLMHVDLKAIAWVNVGLKEVHFKMLE